ncbi:MAG: S1 RNA-binding domain-containing protein, partial [Planctomycetales bacterium]|nr:S1 RNA-binding domain-containing protein [Planctomycetales bacterium]
MSDQTNDGPNADQAEPAPAETPAAHTEQTPLEEAQAPSASRPSDRIRIGANAGDSGEKPQPKPVMTGQVKSSPKPAASKYPPPNVRAQLSPELEAELEAALSGESLDDLISQSTQEAAGELAPETKVTGRVTRQHGDSVFFDLGSHREGVAKLQQFEEDATLATGAEIQLIVIRQHEGLYELSLPTAAMEVGNWEDVIEGQIVEVSVTGVNKGGLECQVANIRGFMPLGQISMYRVENPEEYVGQRLACVVTEANPGKGNLVLSH